MAPRFSVIIPAYNRAKLVVTTVQSILNQSFPDYEVIVVVDGSKDGTKEALETFGNRIRLIIQEGQGAEAARARGAAEARGEYLAFLDDDDLLLPWTLDVYDRVICELNSPPLVLGDMSYFADGDQPSCQGGNEPYIEILKFKDYLSKDVSFGSSCSRIVVQKRAFDESAATRNSVLGHPLDDHHMLLSLSTYTPCILIARPTTVARRMHPHNFSNNVDMVIKAIAKLSRYERIGNTRGPSRRYGRYSTIGGIAWYWAVRGLREGHYVPGLGLIFRCSPHIAAGTIKKMVARFRSNAIPLQLSRER